MSRKLCFLDRVRFGVLLVTFLFVAPIHTFSSEWIKLAPTGGPPPPRSQHTSVYDPASNRLIIFGGCTNVPGPCNTFGRGASLNDLWVLANANGQGGTPTWMQLTPTGGPPPARFRHAAAYDSVNNRMVIWGGDSTFGSLPDLTDVWVLTNANGLDRTGGLPATPNWTQLFPTGGPPTSGVSFPGREVSTAVYDSNTNRMIVFGGDACDPCTFKNDVWVLTNANGLGGTPQWLQLFPTGGPPAPRTYNSAVYDVGGNRMIIFGGLAPGGIGSALVSDTWVLANASGVERVTGAPTTPVWTQLAATGTLPPARGQQAAAYDAATNRMVIFGGFGVAAFLNDVWLLDNANGAGVQTSAWSQILPTGAAPAPRILFYNYQLYDGASNRMLLFGGESSSGVAFNDSWVLTEASGSVTPPTWTQECPAASPPGRYAHAMAYDAARGQMVMFGGADPNINTAFNDTWAWDGINWTQKFPATSPPATSGHAMAYDAARQQVVMFGGAVGSTIVADTWVWDGANWTQKFPANMPSPRLHAAMAYDIARQQVVLFGGGPGSPTAFSDTWVWDGTNWTQKSPTTSPPARCCYGLAYDAVVGQTVLFGGTPDAINFYNDTWVWNGSTWTQKFPATIPTIPRFHHRLAYDTARQQTVLFGGQGPNNTPIYNDTWVWDRTNWTQQFPATSPPGHSLPAMAYDEARSQTVLFGGLSGTSFVNDTWVFGAPTSTTCPIGPPPTIISVSPSSGIQGQTITNFTVNGNNFDPAAVLFFSGTEIAANSYSSRTSTQIVASVSIANAAPTGLRDVSVMNPDGQQGTLSRSFSLLSPTAAIIPPTPVGTTGTPTDQQQTSQDPVSTGNGNYHFERTDFVVPGRGLPIVFQRNYNSLDNYSGPIGANWTHTYNITLFESQTGDVFTKWGDGHGETFALIGGNYVPQHGVFSALTKAPDGSFLLTRKDQSKYNFSSSGKLLSIQDKNGNAILLTYDGTGNLSRIADTVGRNVILSYDASNRITQVTDPASRVFSFTYDSNGNLATSTNPAAGVTRLSYDNNHRVTSITLPNNQLLLQNAYDTAGRVTSQTNGRSFTTTFAYGTPNTGDTTVSDPRANAAIHSYDASLRIVKITDAAGGSTTFTYDSNNDRTSVTNQNAKTTTFAYDARGNITGITDPLANSIAFTYDGKNNLLAATNAKAKTTSFVYDGNGNLTKIQDAVGHATTFSYNGFGQLVSKTDARGNTATFSYDTFANLTRITDALSHSTTLSYDSIGRLTSITDPNGHAATAAYDALSRLVTTNDPLANQTKFAYDAVGNLLKITDANGNTTIYAYDATNNLVSVTDALGHITRYAYDANNNRVTSTNAKGNATSYTYDVLNRLNRIVDPLSFAAVYAYDPVGNVLAVTDAKGQTNQFTYDALNRLLGILYADGKNVAYSYDANGNRTSMVDSHGTTAYSYDDLDRLTSVTHPGGKVVAYAHDPIGNRSSLTYADGKIVNYAYDAANRLSGVMDWLGRRTTYSYDAASNLTGTAYPNQAALAFVYDSANRLTQVSNSYRGSVDNPITSFTYMLDAIGNRLQVTDGSGKSTFYGYDLLYQLDSVRVGSGANVTRFTYDAVGNRLSLNAPNTFINYTYDAADRLLAAGTASFTYDANGNQTSKTQTATGQPIVYSYDAANRLVQARGGAVNSTFAYDGDGNRITQSVGTGTYSYLNDVATALPVVLQESGPDGNISYAYGLGLVSELGSTFDAFYQYDGLGTVVGLTDPTGKLLGRYGYDAWGQTDLSAPGPQLGTKNKFRFTGEALDPGTQLYYLRARYYDPSVGRFASRDLFAGLVGEPLTINKFLYVLNRPVTFSDPSGLAAEKTPATGDTFAPVTNVSLVSNNANSTISTAPTSNASRSASTRAIATACKAIDIVETIFEKTSEFIANRTLNYIYSNGGTQSVSDVPCYSQIPGVGLFFNNVPTAQ